MSPSQTPEVGLAREIIGNRLDCNNHNLICFREPKDEIAGGKLASPIITVTHISDHNFEN